MTTRDFLTLLSLIVAALSVILVSRNTRKSTAVQAQNVDLTRIRDLRHELAEARQEVHQTKAEADKLSVQVRAMSDALTEAYRKQQEMILYARMPGVTIDDWLEHFDEPPALGERVRK